MVLSTIGEFQHHAGDLRNRSDILNNADWRAFGRLALPVLSVMAAAAFAGSSSTNVVSIFLKLTQLVQLASAIELLLPATISAPAPSKCETRCLRGMAVQASA
jgi:hypothetical protein